MLPCFFHGDSDSFPRGTAGVEQPLFPPSFIGYNNLAPAWEGRVFILFLDLWRRGASSLCRVNKLHSPQPSGNGGGRARGRHRGEHREQRGLVEWGGGETKDVRNGNWREKRPRQGICQKGEIEESRRRESTDDKGGRTRGCVVGGGTGWPHCFWAVHVCGGLVPSMV